MHSDCHPLFVESRAKYGLPFHQHMVDKWSNGRRKEFPVVHTIREDRRLTTTFCVLSFPMIGGHSILCHQSTGFAITRHPLTSCAHIVSPSVLFFVTGRADGSFAGVTRHRDSALIPDTQLATTSAVSL